MDQAFEDLKKKIQKGLNSGNFDLSLDEDLSWGVMNLIALEEHFFMTAQKTGKSEYYDLLNQIREQRKALMQKMIPVYEGELWCVVKHLLSSTMRSLEVGTKLQTQKKDKEAKFMFDAAYKIYSIFWAVHLKLVDLKDVKKTPDPKPSGKEWSYEDILNKMVNCCKE